MRLLLSIPAATPDRSWKRSHSSRACSGSTEIAHRFSLTSTSSKPAPSIPNRFGTRLCSATSHTIARLP